MEDIRDLIFQQLRGRRYRAVLTPERDGILSGVEDAAETAKNIGVEWKCLSEEGGRLKRASPLPRSLPRRRRWPLRKSR